MQEELNILVCCHAPLTKRLGGAKVFLELAESLQDLDAEVKLVGPSDVADGLEGLSGKRRAETYSEGLRAYLKKYAGNYDVVEYCYEYLPFLRSDFSDKPLFVARSVLMQHHHVEFSIPVQKGISTLIRKVLGSVRHRESRWFREQSTKTLSEADQIILCNEHDRELLLKIGFDKRKMTVIPFGLSKERRALFSDLTLDFSVPPTIAFVGTFDKRKGALDFPEIVSAVASEIPDVLFHFIGTGQKATVVAAMSKECQKNVQVTASYDPLELPAILSQAWVGVFPSYLEGFPFGVLEMISAGLPVIAYHSPGAPMMLPEDWLVPPGELLHVARKLVCLLKNTGELPNLRKVAKQRSLQFDWTTIARDTIALYREARATRP